MEHREYESGGAFYAMAIITSLILAWLSLLAGVFFEGLRSGSASDVHIRQTALIFLALTLFFLEFTGAYRVGRRRLFEVLYAVFISAVLINLVMLLLPFFDIQYFRSAWTIIIITATQIVLFGIWTYVFHRLYFAFFPRKKAIVVADSLDNAEYCAWKVRKHSREYEVAATMEFSQWEEEQPDCDTVIAYKLTPSRQETLTRRRFEEKLELCVIPDLWELGLYCSRQAQFGDFLVLHLSSSSLSVGQRVVKRFIDIIGAAAGLIVSCAPILVMAAVVLLQDGKNPFFTQERLTRGGRVFKLVKLRSMIPDAESLTGPVLASYSDNRVTPFGRWMRKMRLDELPQFWNVLVGDMSLVGPRPERPHFFELYSKDIPEFSYRLSVKAGITGMAHVYGRYDTQPEERIKLDLHYMMHYSLRMDIKLLIETARIMLSPSYAEGKRDEPGASGSGAAHKAAETGETGNPPAGDGTE